MKIRIYQGAAIAVPDVKGIEFEVNTGPMLAEVEDTPANRDKYLKRREFPKTKAEAQAFKPEKS